MAYLGRDRILARKDELFYASSFDSDSVRQSSYDLRLGEEFYIAGRKAPEKLAAKQPYLALQPGQFAILTCYEMLHLPNDVIGFISLRNRFKMQGLINVSGFHVDPTFDGRLVFAVQNIGPNDVRLKYQDQTFTIFFADVDEGSGKRPDPPRTGILLSDVHQLGANSITLSKLKKDIETVRTVLLIYAPFAVALFIALIMNIVKSGK
jgi:dCTP deaminase